MGLLHARTHNNFSSRNMCCEKGNFYLWSLAQSLMGYLGGAREGHVPNWGYRRVANRVIINGGNNMWINKVNKWGLLKLG